MRENEREGDKQTGNGTKNLAGTAEAAQRARCPFLLALQPVGHPVSFLVNICLLRRGQSALLRWDVEVCCHCAEYVISIALNQEGA